MRFGFRIGLCICFASLMDGCYAQRMYRGDVENPAELMPRAVDIAEIDGEKVSIHSDRVLLVPGSHSLVGNSTGGGILGPTDKSVTHHIQFDVEAGRRYFVKGSVTYGYCVWVEDAETRRVVSTDPKGCGALKASDPVVR